MTVKTFVLKSKSVNNLKFGKSKVSQDPKSIELNYQSKQIRIEKNKSLL